MDFIGVLHGMINACLWPFPESTFLSVPDFHFYLLVSTILAVELLFMAE
jgi:hypothetical protein